MTCLIEGALEALPSTLKYFRMENSVIREDMWPEDWLPESETEALTMFIAALRDKDLLSNLMEFMHLQIIQIELVIAAMTMSLTWVLQLLLHNDIIEEKDEISRL